MMASPSSYNRIVPSAGDVEVCFRRFLELVLQVSSQLANVSRATGLVLALVRPWRSRDGSRLSGARARSWSGGTAKWQRWM